jgi:hypothetical protein
MRLPLVILTVLCTSVASAASGHARTAAVQSPAALGDSSSGVVIRSERISVQAGSAAPVAGNGRLVTEERPADGVSALRLQGSFDARLIIGPPARLTIEADENLLPIIRTTIAAGQLTISADRSYVTAHRVLVSLSLPHLTAISAAGSNSIAASGLREASLSIALDGSNDAVLTGAVSRLRCRMAGATRLAAARLVSEEATIALAGAGEASLDVRDRLQASIAGAGQIVVHGRPRARETRVEGAGRIVFAED